MKLKILSDDFTILKLPSNEKIPEWFVLEDSFKSLTMTPDELSVICRTSIIPENCKCKKENNWIIIKIDEVLDFSQIGIISKISGILSNNNIGIFVISTFNTDYILIKVKDKEKAIKCLSCVYDVVL